MWTATALRDWFSFVPWLIGSSGWGVGGGLRDNSAEILFQSFLKEATMSSSGMGRDVHSLMLSISISSANHDNAHPPRCLEGRFCGSFRGVWHAQTMPVSISWELPEEVLVWTHKEGTQSSSARNRWSCAPSRTCGEVSPGTWFWKPGSFFQSQQAESMFHSCRGEWR